MLCDYDGETFSALHHYNDAKMFVNSDAVKVGIDELGKVITENGLETDVGVCLLHKHFDMSDDEILLEIPLDGASKLSPVNRAALKSEILPYMWKMNKHSRWTPLEFTLSTKCMQSKLEKVMRNQAFIQEIGNILTRLQIHDVLGLSLLHREHINSFNSGTLETSDEHGRILTIGALNKHKKCDLHETVQTLWKFGIGKLGEDVCHHCTHCWHGKK
ncbi:unnamed protein product [Rotaria magnacalcarata]|uniref:Uncharacterized protein n=3 Tax=Rotaria magnacalcarata TaxID=392030 RepID=A0A816UT06_9BILA|nr:unnamed protein product [Rotaria magnacalcarata]